MNVVLSDQCVILSGLGVILSAFHVILSGLGVILSAAKDLAARRSRAASPPAWQEESDGTRTSLALVRDPSLCSG